MDKIKKAQLYKALSDANRLIIMDELKDGERCACVLLEKLNITQPTLSHHMKQLVEQELVFVRKEGKWTHYRRNEQLLQELGDL